MALPSNPYSALAMRLIIAKAINQEKRDAELLEPIVQQYKQIRENERKVEESLGRFVRLWSSCEYSLYRTLVFYSKVSDGVAKAIFSGARAKQMINFIKAIAHNTDLQKERRNDFDHLAAQIAVINDARDMLLHNFHEHYMTFQPVQEGTDPVVSNFARASRVGNERGLVISDSDIGDMCGDLMRIKKSLELHLDPFSASAFESQSTQVERSPWLYKPRQQ